MPKKSSRSGSCQVGKIRRSSYTRKTHSKKTSKVKRTYVPSTCVPAKGKAIKRGTKTPAREKVLPKPGTEISLELYGYGTKKSDAVRQVALRKAAKAHGDLKIERRLVLISNYQANPEAKRIMKADVKYMSLMHARHMRAEGKKSSSVYEKK